MGWDRRKPLSDFRVTQRDEEYDAQGRLVKRPRRGRGGLGMQDAPGSFVILAICLVAFAVCNLGLGEVPELLITNPLSGSLFPGLFTDMFMHANSSHLICNMLALYFLGPIVERDYGTPRFLTLFLGAGILATLAQSVAVPGPSLGASGALSGVMAAFIRHYPHARLFLFFVLPLPAWIVGVLWLLFNLLGELHVLNFNIAFMAHTAGFVAGLVFSLIFFPPGKQRAA